MYDEQPDDDPHGECRSEIERLQARIRELEERNARLLETQQANLDAVCEELGHAERVQGDWPGDAVCPRCSDVEVYAGIVGEIVPPMEPGQ